MTAVFANLNAAVAPIRKAIVVVVGIAGTLLADNLVPAAAHSWVTYGVAVATVLLTYLVPNKTA